MANWVIERRKCGAGDVFYDNLSTGRRWACGTVAADVTDDAVVEWIIWYGQPAPGDRIVFSDRRSFFYQPRVVAQA